MPEASGRGRGSVGEPFWEPGVWAVETGLLKCKLGLRGLRDSERGPVLCGGVLRPTGTWHAGISCLEGPLSLPPLRPSSTASV